MVNKERVISFLETPNPRGLSTKQQILENEDMKPVEAERRLWSARNFVTFWIADGFNLNTWYIASAMLPALSWWQAWICVWIGYSCTGILVAMGGRPGGIYHIGFPVACRSSFGIFGSYWPVLNRAVMACIWTGVQSWIGGQCVVLLLRAMAPSYNNLPNSMPASSGTDTKNFLGFFIFVLLHIPCVWVPVERIRHLFTVKSIVAPIAGIAYCAWVVSRAGGLGPILTAPAQSSGSELGWHMVNGIMSSIANFATLICNASDFSRFAKKPSNAVIPQVIAIPMTFGLVSLVGIFVASSSQAMYGEALWDPLALMGRMLDDDPSSSRTRAGVFFIAAAFIIAQLGTNIAANTISAGTDLTALCPRFLNIRRGGYIAVIVAFAMCPWHLLSSSNSFTTYLASYSVFLSAIIGPILCDYFLLRRGRLHVPDLYSFSENGHAWYWKGINWRAYVAYVCGIIPNAPGFGGAVGATEVPIGATRVYQLNFWVGFLVSGGIYYVLSRWVSPVPGLQVKGWHEDLNYEPEYEDHVNGSPSVVYAGANEKDYEDGKLA